MLRFERPSIRIDVSGIDGPNRNFSEVSMDNKTTVVQQNRHWAGLDWGGTTHTVSVVEQDRMPVAHFTVPADIGGLKELTARLELLGGIAGIAIESTCDPVVDFLEDRGFTIYPVNPKLSKTWRESNSVAGVKSDARDSLVLAVELARRHEALRPLIQCDPATTALDAQCRILRALIDHRTELLQSLRATLRHYFPAVLPFFDNWGSPTAWRFLKRFSRPEKLAAARKSTLVRFLKANQIGLSPTWLQRLDKRTEVLAWPTPADSVAYEAMAMATIAQLLALQPHIDTLDKHIGEAVAKLSTTQLLASLPGAGKRLTPALTAMVLSVEKAEDRLQALRCLSGVAPVQKQSGKSRRMHIRRRCNKYWRDVLHLYAFCSLRFCAWAKAFYSLHREKGDTHATALRKLADKWLKIINRMLEKKEEYDDARYVQALLKSRSPVCDKLCG